MELNWQWHTFEDLSGRELYAILALRQQVFVVEQQCAYLDCDDLDQYAWHLAGWRQGEKDCRPVAYLRVLPPGKENQLPIIGRLLTHPQARRKGIGETLLTKALHRIEKEIPGSSIRISAQHYLLSFYERFGFFPISDIYLEDGISHISMIRHPSDTVMK